MSEQQKKIIAVTLAVIAVIILLFFVFVRDEDFTSHREMLQEATDEYIADTGCYPATRELSFGNPSPIDFQKLYHKLDDDFEINRDLYYWITTDGRVWISETDVPEMEIENDLLTYDRQGRLRYNLHYYENNELKTEETRERELDISEINYAISEYHGKGLETPPANYDYEGYEKHRPLVRIKNTDQSLALLAMIREEDRRRTPVQNMIATIGGLFREERTWAKEYGFDIYGEQIIEGRYEKEDSLLGKVQVKTEDSRESYWIDLMDPTDVGICFAADWEEVDIDPVDPDIEDPITPIEPTDPDYETRLVTVKGGPKRNPDDFEDAISFTTQDGFSGLLYRYGDPFIEEGERKTVYNYITREDDDFPQTIEYDEDGFYGTLTLASVIQGFKEVSETRSERNPDRLPEKIEYDEDGYYGTLEPVGDYETTRRSRGSTTRRQTVEEIVTRSDRDFPSTISYSEGGYTGTLEKEEGYRRIPGDEEDQKDLTETVERSDRNFPDYLEYDKDGYEGRLEKDGGYIRNEDDEFEQTYIGEVEKEEATSFTANYSGSVTKEGSSAQYTYYQDYKGEVVKDGTSARYTYYQDYSGEVSKDGSYKQSYRGTVKSDEKFEQTYSGEVTKFEDDKFEQDYKGTVARTGDQYEATYSGEVTRRVSGGSYTLYTQTYEGIIRARDEDHYIGIYSGTVSTDGFYQLYRGNLRRSRN